VVNESGGIMPFKQSMDHNLLPLPAAPVAPVISTTFFALL
jgi:hypothetical protein